MTPPLPALPSQDDEDALPSESRRDAATCLGVAALAFFGMGMCLLVGVVMAPAFRWLLITAAVLTALPILHYLTWGRLLSRMREREEKPGA